MAMKLTNVAVTPANSTRTLVYTSPVVGQSATVFDGTITNIDDFNKQVHFITLEVEMTPGVFKKLGNKIAVPYGLSPRVVKTNLLPGQKLHITVSTGNTVDVFLSIVER